MGVHNYRGHAYMSSLASLKSHWSSCGKTGKKLNTTPVPLGTKEGAFCTYLANKTNRAYARLEVYARLPGVKPQNIPDWRLLREHTHIHTHTRTHTQIHSRERAHTHTHPQSQLPHTHTHRHARTNVHPTYTHTYACTEVIIIIIIDIYIAHIAEASRRLETGVEMTWDEEKYIMQNNTNIHDINIHRKYQIIAINNTVHVYNAFSAPFP